MIRTFLYILVTILVITFLRGIIGIITKAFGQLMSSESSGPGSQPQGGQAKSGFGGELKKDPVCGVFVSTATSVKKTAGGAVHHFCSAACRDKFSG